MKGLRRIDAGIGFLDNVVAQNSPAMKGLRPNKEEVVDEGHKLRKIALL